MNALPLNLRLAKLIPMLATDHDGEVIATARAIERTLRSEGLDLHALANLLAGNTEPKILPVPSTAAAQGQSEWTWAAVAEFCQANHGGSLTPKELAFVKSMLPKLVCDGKPTEKQADWLRDIFAKVREVAA